MREYTAMIPARQQFQGNKLTRYTQISNLKLYSQNNDLLSHEEPNLHSQNPVYKSLDPFAYELIKATTEA